MARPFQSPLCAFVLLLLATTTAAATDWTDPTNPIVVKALPDNTAAQPQNPPTFSWPQNPTNPDSYQIEIRSNGKTITTFSTAQNWYLPAKALPVGAYTWRITPVPKTNWSRERPFLIAPESALFEVPENQALRATVLSRVRPRLLSADFVPVSAWTAAMKTERLAALNKLTSEVDKIASSAPPIRDADWPLVTGNVITEANVKQTAAIRTRIFAAERQLEAAALLYRLTGEKRFYDDTIKLGDQMAGLNPDGSTSYANQDQATRSIALSLVKAVDLLGTSLDEGRRKSWLAIVAVRGEQIYRDLTANRIRIDEYPFDSHGGQNLGYLAVIATLALGDVPEAANWFNFSFRDYASWVMSWSGPEGGFANGTAYGQFSAFFALRIWQPLEYATGVNLFNKPWTRGFITFMMQFVPPGSQTHVFGDGHDTAPEFIDLKSFISRSSSPEAAWYANAVPNPEDPISLLEAQYPLPVSIAKSMKPPANAAFYPSIGWVAIHSDIANPNRTSLYFKSSQFGSFSHSHADQNGFVLTKASVPLLIETGWYDYFDSPLQKNWYRQTKSHNAITFDKGIGQVTEGYAETLVANGKITAFSTSPEFDYAEGDATAAYGGQLGSAIRKIWYLRSSDAVVVWDQLSAPSPHQFEWNFHSPATINNKSTGVIEIENNGQSVCLKPVYTDTNHYEKRVGPAPAKGKFEDHAAFVSNKPVTSQVFLTVLDVGCKNLPVTLTTQGKMKALQVGNQTINVPN